MKDFAEFLSPERVLHLRDRGVLILDVDDTLLARRNDGTAEGETYSDSEAARMVPKLLAAGISTALVTGHGWEQLNSRLAAPLAAAVSDEGLFSRLTIFANRGATRVFYTDSGFHVNREYSKPFEFEASELITLQEILWGAASSVSSDTDPVIEVRENVVVSLRPVRQERTELIERLRAMLTEHGFGQKFRVDAAGRSTIEVMSGSVSKTLACEKIFEHATADSGRSKKQIIRASIYIGDEFGKGGNDAEVAMNFPEMDCFCVGFAEDSRKLENVKLAGVRETRSPSDATAQLMSQILETLD